MPVLVTVGHGALDRCSLGTLLQGAAVDLVVDVRRFPGSRTNPDVRQEELQSWLPETGIAYRWDERLGGRRRLPPGVAERDTWWTDPAFRAYAAHTRTQAFQEALDSVLTAASRRQVAVMCSETLWWRCHRRLIADVAVLAHGAPVAHLSRSGGLAPHVPAAGARMNADGLLVWDGPQETEGEVGR